MQMGPAIGAIFSTKGPAEKAVTRVVAGLDGFHAYKFPDRGSAFAASEMQASTPSGDIFTSHWLIGADAQKTLCILDLKVTTLFLIILRNSSMLYAKQFDFSFSICFLQGDLTLQYACVSFMLSSDIVCSVSALLNAWSNLTVIFIFALEALEMMLLLQERPLTFGQISCMLWSFWHIFQSNNAAIGLPLVCKG